MPRSASFHTWSAEEGTPWPNIGIEPKDLSWSKKTKGVWEERDHLYDQPKVKPGPIEVQVTDEDIEKGVRWLHSNSPVSLAINRTCGPGDVLMYWTFVMVGPWWYAVPEKAQTFIKRFDRDRSVKPFTFTLLPYRQVGPTDHEMLRHNEGRFLPEHRKKWPRKRRPDEKPRVRAKATKRTARRKTTS